MKDLVLKIKKDFNSGLIMKSLGIKMIHVGDIEPDVRTICGRRPDLTPSYVTDQIYALSTQLPMSCYELARNCMILAMDEKKLPWEN